MDFRNNNRNGPRRFGGGRDRGNRGNFGRNNNFRREMHDVDCDKCGKHCRVPFKPSNDKPVLCSECFEKQGNKHIPQKSQNNNNQGASGISKEQFEMLNKKIDKILFILENLEFEEIGDDEEEDLELDDIDGDEEDEDPFEGKQKVIYDESDEEEDLDNEDEDEEGIKSS